MGVYIIPIPSALKFDYFELLCTMVNQHQKFLQNKEPVSIFLSLSRDYSTLGNMGNFFFFIKFGNQGVCSETLVGIWIRNSKEKIPKKPKKIGLDKTNSHLK
jgi:hypothetical protein